MELDRIYPLTTRVKQRLHCSQQMAELKSTLFITWSHDKDDPYEVMDRCEIELSDAFQVNVLTAKGN